METAIVMPAFNEEENILGTVKNVCNFIGKEDIIIVDDGSKEPIADEVQKIQTELSFQPIIIRKEKN